METILNNTEIEKKNGNNLRMKVAFLDRDGVINEDIGYLCEWKYFEYKESVITALQQLIAANYQLIVVTNQSGIARGYYTEEDFIFLNTKMKLNLKKLGIPLLDVFYCPHYLGGAVKQYSIDCDCRKPKPGLFLTAFERYNIDLNKAVMFGDRVSDMQAASAAGIRHKFLVGDATKLEVSEIGFVNLLEAVDYFLQLCDRN